MKRACLLRDYAGCTLHSAAADAWSGGRLEIRSGTYDESLTISKRVRMIAVGGPVRIGG